MLIIDESHLKKTTKSNSSGWYSQISSKVKIVKQVIQKFKINLSIHLFKVQKKFHYAGNIKRPKTNWTAAKKSSKAQRNRSYC
jgi:hypothetical protein